MKFSTTSAMSTSPDPLNSASATPASPPRRAKARQGGNAVLWARGLLALVGGYAVAATWAVALARLLPGSLADAALVATMASFVIYTLAAIWAYAARSLVRASVGLLIAAAAGALLAAQLAGAGA